MQTFKFIKILSFLFLIHLFLACSSKKSNNLLSLLIFFRGDNSTTLITIPKATIDLNQAFSSSLREVMAVKSMTQLNANLVNVSANLEANVWTRLTKPDLKILVEQNQTLSFAIVKKATSNDVYTVNNNDTIPIGIYTASGKADIIGFKKENANSDDKSGIELTNKSFHPYGVTAVALIAGYSSPPSFSEIKTAFYTLAKARDNDTLENRISEVPSSLNNIKSVANSIKNDVATTLGQSTGKSATIPTNIFKDMSRFSSVSMSSDGSIIALGDNSDGFKGGVVYVYEKDVNGIWKSQKIKPKSLNGRNSFGDKVDLSDDGKTLAISDIYDSTGARSVNGNISANTSWKNERSGAVYIYEKNSNNWVQKSYIKAFNPGKQDNFASAISLSGDGKTLAVGANLEDGNLGDTSSLSTQSAVNSLQVIKKITDGNFTFRDDALFGDSGAVYLYEKLNENWTSSVYIKAKMSNSGGQLGVSVSLDKDGDTLAVGSKRTGVYNNQEDQSDASSLGGLANSGVVYTFQKTSGNWTQKQLLEASNRYCEDNFGSSLSLSDDGKSLLIGAPSENAKTTGVSNTKPEALSDNCSNFNRSDNRDYDSGAAYLFQLTNNWNQTLYIKASNTGKGDKFGTSVALSGDGKTFLVGATEEDSGNKNSDDNLKSNSGSVYLYKLQSSQWKFNRYIKSESIEENSKFGTGFSLSKDASSFVIFDSIASAFLY